MKHIESIKWWILFTDIKDFTLKTSLLTQKQIEKLLNKQDEIVLPIINKYFWKIIKTIWDSYMIVFEKAENTTLASIEIQNEIEKYNSNIDLNLYKIELRISADFWNLERKMNLWKIDYFWEAVNLASRLQHKTPENKIFITWNLQKEINKNKSINSLFIWKTSFKWVLYEVDIYEVLYKKDDIKNLKEWKIKSKNINDLLITQDSKKQIKEIDDLIFKFASVTAILWLQPIPFLDSYSVLPFHVYLLREIAKKYSIELNKEEAKEILTTIIWSIWTSYILSQSVVWLSKIWLIWFAWYLMIPVNFALTYAIWKILSYYFYIKSQWVKATNKELQTLFNYSIKSWKQIAKKDKNKIIETWKKYKKKFQSSMEIFLKEKKNFLEKTYNRIIKK